MYVFKIIDLLVIVALWIVYFNKGGFSKGEIDTVYGPLSTDTLILISLAFLIPRYIITYFKIVNKKKDKANILVKIWDFVNDTILIFGFGSLFFVDYGYSDGMITTQFGNIPIGTVLLVASPFALVNNFHLLNFARNRRRICAWCGSKKLSFVEGTQYGWFWKYRNKDGSRDKRVKDNYQQAGYESLYDCNLCQARTEFEHFVSKNPGRHVKVARRTLMKDGTGERTAKDWADPNGITVNPRKENRVGKR